MKRTISEMGGIRTQSPKFASMFLLLVLASVALPTFNVGEFTVLYSLSQINVWFAFLGGTTIILGAYYMLKMYQQVMLETNTKVFADVTLMKDLLWFLSSLYYSFFGMYPKPITDNHTSL
jgi:NADH-quinone oxidoreductase subunit M